MVKIADPDEWMIRQMKGAILTMEKSLRFMTGKLYNGIVRAC